MTFDPTTTALVLTDPQRDVLLPDGALGDLFAARAAARGVVPNLVRLTEAARAARLPVLCSYVRWSESEHRDWQPTTPFQSLLLQRKALCGRGADFVDELDPGPDAVWLTPRRGPTGFWGNDIDIQLRQRGIRHVILAGLVANLCLEANVRDAVTHGYEVTVVSDATDAASEEAYQAALATFGLLATRVATTDEVTAAVRAASPVAA